MDPGNPSMKLGPEGFGLEWVGVQVIESKLGDVKNAVYSSE